MYNIHLIYITFALIFFYIGKNTKCKKKGSNSVQSDFFPNDFFLKI